MSQDYNNPAFKKLLQKLQEESWQLELLISGFAIFGLFSAYPTLQVASKASQNDNNVQLTIFLFIALAACSILIFNLLLHVLLRGLWIGALGLRYVSGDIDYEKLNYGKKFSGYLEKKVGSFDRYIARLENYCSVIFAISFLLIFYVLAFALTFTIIGLIVSFMIDGNDSSSVLLWIGIPLLVFMVIGMFLTFFDFLSLGLLKKKNWISKLYFPFYWVFSFITLAFLYRPLVYNFLDNKFGKRLSFLLVPVYFALLMITTLYYNHSNYFEFDENSSNIIANSNNYENELIDESDFIEDIAINSKVISDTYVKVFIVFDDYIEDQLYKFNPKLKPDTDNRGVKTRFIVINGNELSDDKTLQQEYLKTFNSIYSVKIDSTLFESEFVLGKTIKNQKGFETYIGIKNLSEGKHQLKVIRKRIRKSDTISVLDANIPFWYYPD
ncbi:MAG: hypothetical protein Tsb0033_08150 [Winogradskyella sp.]